MSTTETPAPASPTLTPAERDLQEKVLGAPVEWPPSTKSYLEDFVTTLLPTQSSLEAMVARIAHPVGFWLLIPDDLTAQTGVYEYTHPLTSLKYLYCNGAAASQTTYAALYSLWGANKYGADSGGNFLLPDTRGRSLWLAGTNANTDVGDTDGQSEATREPKHKHTSAGLTITGALATESAHTHEKGSYAVGGGPFASSSHTHTLTTSVELVQSGAVSVADHAVYTTSTPSDTTVPTFAGTSAAGSAHTHGNGTLDVGGEAGSGMGGSDAVAHIVIGSLVIRF